MAATGNYNDIRDATAKELLAAITEAIPSATADGLRVLAEAFAFVVSPDQSH